MDIQVLNDTARRSAARLARRLRTPATPPTAAEGPARDRSTGQRLVKANTMQGDRHGPRQPVNHGTPLARFGQATLGAAAVTHITFTSPPR